MFNVTVLKMNDIKKCFIVILVITILIIIVNKYFPQLTSEKKIIQKVFSENDMSRCLEQTIPAMSVTHDEKKNVASEDLLQEVLKTQISSIHGMESIEEKAQREETAEEQENANKEVQNNQNTYNQSIEVAKTGLTTEVITVNPITESYNTQYGKVKIKNETEYELTENMLIPDITIENKNIVLFHTHSCESYTSSDAYSYIPTGTFRTTDLNFTVTRVGTELENQLKQYNYNVIHDTSYHDYPAYNGSYTRSLATVENILQTTPADIVMDVHRDAVGSRSDYAPTVKIGENDVAAQIMFVIRNR